MGSHSEDLIRVGDYILSGGEIGAITLLDAIVRLIPGVMGNMDSAETATLTLPAHLQAMVPEVVAGDPTALRVFLAEGLKASETGKGTSSQDMSTTGVWSVRDPRDATAERGRQETDDFVQAAVKFIERWNELRPAGTP